MNDRSRPPSPGAPACRLALLVGALMLVAGCGEGPAADGFRMLAKANLSLDSEQHPEPVLGPATEPGVRVATDEATARKLWDALAVDELEPTSDPAERGRHGELGAIDFAEQVVVLWRGGESGTCPQRVDDVTTTADGVVEVTLARSRPGGPCTDDYVPYAVLAAVDRGAMPATLPARGRAVGPDEQQRTTFPVVDAAAPDAGEPR